MPCPSYYMYVVSLCNDIHTLGMALAPHRTAGQGPIRLPTPVLERQYTELDLGHDNSLHSPRSCICRAPTD